MPTIQIKTLELLIIGELHGVNGYNRAVQAAFTQMLHHFANEEYLYGIEHTEIINKIYVDNFYEYRSAEALSRELFIDIKTLLCYRKSYIRMFAKYYLNLSTFGDDAAECLYERMLEDKRIT